MILDEFESSIQNTVEEKYKKGLKLLHKNFFKILNEKGLKQIQAIWEKFDPYYHEALMIEEREKEEDNIVLEDLQKGYIFKTNVIRPSKVKVSKNRGEK